MKNKSLTWPEGSTRSDHSSQPHPAPLSPSQCLCSAEASSALGHHTRFIMPGTIFPYLWTLLLGLFPFSQRAAHFLGSVPPHSWPWLPLYLLPPSHITTLVPLRFLPQFKCHFSQVSLFSLPRLNEVSLLHSFTAPCYFLSMNDSIYNYTFICVIWLVPVCFYCNLHESRTMATVLPGAGPW